MEKPGYPGTQIERKEQHATEKKQAELQETVVSETKEKKQTKLLRRRAQRKKRLLLRQRQKRSLRRQLRQRRKSSQGCERTCGEKADEEGICRNDEEGICQRSKSDRR